MTARPDLAEIGLMWEAFLEAGRRQDSRAIQTLGTDLAWRVPALRARVKELEAALDRIREPTTHMLSGVPDWDRAVWKTMVERAGLPPPKEHADG